MLILYWRIIKIEICLPSVILNFVVDDEGKWKHITYVREPLVFWNTASVGNLQIQLHISEELCVFTNISVKLTEDTCHWYYTVSCYTTLLALLILGLLYLSLMSCELMFTDIFSNNYAKAIDINCMSQGVVAQAVIPELGWGRQITRSGVPYQPGQDGETSSLLKIQKK